MKNKKSLISTILLCAGLLLAVCSIFSFFGSAMKLSTEVEELFIVSSVFILMFGGDATILINGQVSPYPWPVKCAPVLTIVLVIEIIVILLAIIIAVGYFTKKLDPKKITICTYVVSSLMLVGVILVFASKKSMLGVFPEESDKDVIVKLGSGLIAYIVLNFVGIATNVASVVIHKKSV